MAVNAVPGFDLQPSAQQVPLSTNYITNFDFLNQYLPDTYEKEFERYGNRTVASFLRMVGAEMPSNSDLIKWAEQGRLHVKYQDCTSASAAGAGTRSAVWTIPNNTTNFNPALAGGARSIMSVNSIDVASNAVEASHYITQGTTNGNNEVDRITSLVIGPGETVVVKSVTANNVFNLIGFEDSTTSFPTQTYTADSEGGGGGAP